MTGDSCSNSWGVTLSEWEKCQERISSSPCLLRLPLGVPSGKLRGGHFPTIRLPLGVSSGNHDVGPSLPTIRKGLMLSIPEWFTIIFGIDRGGRF